MRKGPDFLETAVRFFRSCILQQLVSESPGTRLEQLAQWRATADNRLAGITVVRQSNKSLKLNTPMHLQAFGSGKPVIACCRLPAAICHLKNNCHFLLKAFRIYFICADICGTNIC